MPSFPLKKVCIKPGALHIVPNERLGRVLGALEAGQIGGMAIGALLMTVLIQWIGLRPGLALIGLTVTLAVVPGLPSMRVGGHEIIGSYELGYRLRRYPQDVAFG